MLKNNAILRIAIPSPLKQSFDYLMPVDENGIHLAPGIRIEVPFNGKTRIGILLEVASNSDFDHSKLKTAHRLIDHSPILSDELIKLIGWASHYYQHPIGETYQVALPSLARKGHPMGPIEDTGWVLSNKENISIPKHATKQQQVVAHFQENTTLTKISVKSHGFSLQAIKSLERSGVIEAYQHEQKPVPIIFNEAGFNLDQQQQACIDKFNALEPGYHPILLEGITGSGKTEVYLQLVETTLKKGQQVLILVPEIGLTPQTLARFQRRFDCPMAIFHSNLTDKQRLQHWQQARQGLTPIIIGTRSALFTPCPSLGLIIIDEEHDLSYKQQDTLRYSARDLACVRANINQIPIVMGSATPSLESLFNVENNKFKHWLMASRAGNAQSADIIIHDIRQAAMTEGIADTLFDAMHQRLKNNEQVLLFINRRGFAPALICHDCGWVHQCHACDAKLTIHRQANQSRCHHCGAFEQTPTQCPECLSSSLELQGAGTERLALQMQKWFPKTPCYRIDRDTTNGKDAMQDMLINLQNESAAILIGTQMLAKGHHLPNVTLVIVIDADAGLMGTDYRAIERFGQLITQVTGRSGRGNKAGQAIIQTHYPEHQQLLKLVHFGYHRFAMDVLAERKILNLPPFSYMALIRLEAMNPEEANAILIELSHVKETQLGQRLGPFPAGLARRAHYFRFQLIIRAATRAHLHHIVKAIWEESRTLIKSRHRFSIDIDPQDMS